jgi:Methyl-viologen-reducing hydrogenase, delta subunit
MVMEHFTRKLLAEAGVHPDRFVLDWASAAQAPLYVDLITRFTKRVKDLGPLGASDGKPLESIKAGLLAAKSAASSVKLRTQFAKLTQEMRRENDYSKQILETRMLEKLNDAILREMQKRI